MDVHDVVFFPFLPFLLFHCMRIAQDQNKRVTLKSLKKKWFKETFLHIGWRKYINPAQAIIEVLLEDPKPSLEDKVHDSRIFRRRVSQKRGRLTNIHAVLPGMRGLEEFLHYLA